MAKDKKKKDRSPRIRNRRASYDYALEQDFVAGIMLTGAEVKSVRDGRASISEGYCYFEGDELFIKGMHIAEFKNAGYVEQNPDRNRKLLLNRQELKKIHQKVREKGYTIVPVELFFSETGYAKLKIALGKGKKTYDKRDDIKQKDIKREMDRYA